MDAHGWDDRYSAARADAGNLWAALPHADLRRLVAQLTPGTALDLATGDGRNAIWLTGRGWAVTAVDFSIEGLGTARERADAAGADVDWQLGDVTAWSPPARFDLVTMTYLHLGEAENANVVRRAASWVAPGGTLIVIGHDVDNLTRGAGGPQDPSILYTARLLREAAGDLTVNTAEQITRDTRADPEGPAEDGAVAIDTLLHAVRTATG